MRAAVLGLCGAIVAVGLAAGQAAAHPHMFIDVGLTFRFDAEGRATGVTVEWHYDEFFTLSYLTDQGYDPDFDGVLTAEEQARLTGFDTRWQAGHAGDSYALLGEVPLALSGPTAPTARMEGGRIVTSHHRTFAEPVPMTGQPLVLQVYDPSFYTAYTIAYDPVLQGAPADCLVQVFEPDRAAADAILQAALEELSGSADVEAEFPAVGAAYAEEARVTCGLG
ncbi:MAG: hypothetical protein RIR62_422 [Pseudomonadota bacterium]|jgi:polyphosphate kinase